MSSALVTSSTPHESLEKGLEKNLSGTIPHLFPAVRSLSAEVVLCLAGVLFMAVAAQVRIYTPLGVPFTFQTLGVLGIGILYGRRLAPITLGLYVALGAIGLPLFNGFAGGWSAVSGPTFGYLLAYPIAGWLIGRFARPETYRSPLRVMTIILAAEVLIFSMGAAWLVGVTQIPLEAAIMGGVLLFLPWELVKVAILAVGLPVGEEFVRSVRTESDTK